MDIILDAFLSEFISRKNDGESLQDYTRILKMSTEILESHLGGPLIIEKNVNNMEVHKKIF